MAFCLATTFLWDFYFHLPGSRVSKRPGSLPPKRQPGQTLLSFLARGRLVRKRLGALTFLVLPNTFLKKKEGGSPASPPRPAPLLLLQRPDPAAQRGGSYLLQPPNPGVHLSVAPVITLVSGGVLIAPNGFLAVLLRLVDLAQLLPEMRLALVPQQSLDAAMDGLQLPVQGPWGQIPGGGAEGMSGEPAAWGASGAGSLGRGAGGIQS